MLNPSLRALDARTLDQLAKHYAAQAKDCRIAEEIKSRRAERRAWAEHKAGLLALPDLVAARAFSVGTGTAIRLVAKETGLPAETVQANWRRHLAEKERRARISRDRAIMRRARLGQSNAEIGESVGLHPASISRIVQRILRETGSLTTSAPQRPVAVASGHAPSCNPRLRASGNPA